MDHIQQRYAAGAALFNQGKHAECRQTCAEILAAQPYHADALYLSGIASYKLGDHSTALNHLRQAIAANGTVPTYYTSLATILDRLGDAGAAEICREGLIAIPSDTALRQMRVAFLEKAGDASALRESYAAWYAHAAGLPQPDSKNAIEKIGEFMRRSGVLFMQSGRLTEAESILDLADRFSDGNVDVLKLLHDTYAGLKDWRRLEAICRRLVVPLRDSGSFWFSYATAEARLGNTAAAGKYFQRAMKLMPQLAQISQRRRPPQELLDALRAWYEACDTRGYLRVAGAAVIWAVAFGALLQFQQYLLASILVIASLLLPIAAEVIYRLILYRAHGVAGETLIVPPHPARATGSFQFGSASAIDYHKDLGFTYRPGAALHFGVCDGGVVTLPAMASFDKHGNIGDSAANYESSDVRVLTFGDSFTASIYSRSGLHWPHFFAKALERSTGKTVSAVNFGREFYGLLQMISLARDAAPKWRPDLILIAYITRDLRRPRSWGFRRFMGGRERYLRQFDSRNPPDERLYFDDSAVDSRVTADWLKERAEKKDRDAILDEVEYWHMRLRQRGDERARYITSPQHSFLWNRFIRGDAFAVQPSSNNRYRSRFNNVNEFLADTRVREDLQALRALGIPFEFVHLPAAEEIAAKAEYTNSPLYHQLKAALEHVTEKRTHDLLPYIAKHTFNLADFTISADDDHPSTLGEKVYGESIAQLVMDRGMLAHATGRENRSHAAK